jgi:hypothetical protein
VGVGEGKHWYGAVRSTMRASHLLAHESPVGQGYTSESGPQRTRVTEVPQHAPLRVHHGEIPSCREWVERWPHQLGRTTCCVDADERWLLGRVVHHGKTPQSRRCCGSTTGVCTHSSETKDSKHTRASSNSASCCELPWVGGNHRAGRHVGITTGELEESEPNKGSQATTWLCVCVAKLTRKCPVDAFYVKSTVKSHNKVKSFHRLVRGCASDGAVPSITRRAYIVATTFVLRVRPCRARHLSFKTPSVTTSSRHNQRLATMASKTKVVGGDGHTASVIWLHGLGDSPAGWLPACREMHSKLKSKGHIVKFSLPEAPVQPVSCNGG